MGIRNLLTFIALALALTIAVEARHLQHQDVSGFVEPNVVLIENYHPIKPAAPQARSIKQARVLPGAVVLKKLVLLKFKKLLPVKFVLLRSTSENEAELLPVYPTSEIPANVQFIPTPNGISGHKDVQAIAIPNELHEQLQMQGLTDAENIEALLSEAQQQEEQTPISANEAVHPQMQSASVLVNKSDENQILEGVSQVEDKPLKADEDQPLKVDETDEDQPLENHSAQEEKPEKVTSPLRGIPVDHVTKSGVKSTAHTTAVEGIPLYLYSVDETPQVMVPLIGRRKESSNQHFVLQRRKLF